MEVGAVKQAFNNEVILLKKKLDQAKIQIINKLTRKAKTLTQKKAPEHLAEKIKRKATAAVNVVMAIKKIHNKDIARFAITHTGNLNDFLNKPTSSPAERACARLLLHKALQDKYKLLRSRFADVPIKDLFMSRQERLKIKKEEKDKKKLKKKEKEEKKRKRESEKKNEKTLVQAEGDWSVEDIDIDELILNKKFVPKRKTKDGDGNDDSEIQSDDESSITKQVAINTNDLDSDGDSNNESDVEKSESVDEDPLNMSGDETDNEDELNNRGDDDSDNEEQGNNQHSDEDDDNSKRNLSDAESVASSEAYSKDTKQTRVMEETEKSKQGKPSNIKPVKEDNRKKLPKQNKDKTKTKISEKMQSKKTKTCSDNLETPQGNRIVDPFFITATGENYMSIVEPRAPDEVKEVHKQGNRQMRRAAIFGYVPKGKPRFSNNFSNKHREHGNFSNDNGNSRFGGKNDKFDRQNGFRDSGHNKFENNDGYRKRDFSNKKFKSNSFNNKAGDSQDRSHTLKRKLEASDSFGKKPSETEKLHPSWAAKKKMSSVQPFQGKKIVFE